MFRFEDPSAFAYLWFLPILFIVYKLYDARAHKKIADKIGSRLYPFLTSSVSQRKRRIKIILETLVVILFVVALARPQMGQSQQKVNSMGVEMMLVVDVSVSMLAEDLRPSRLEQVKADLARLLDYMPGNKVGVIAFAGSSALLCPLTSDPAAIKMYLESLSPDSVSTQGTSFKEAFQAAKEAFERGGVTADNTTKVTRVILVASDGEDQEEGAEEFAQAMVKEGTRIFTVAYGTQKGAPIPQRDTTGFLKGYKKDKSGNTILTAVHGEELRKLAKAGQGSFYHAVIGGNHLESIAEDISKLEKAEFESSMATQYEERFQIPLFLALLLGLLEIFLGERANSFRLWRGRYEVPPA